MLHDYRNGILFTAASSKYLAHNRCSRNSCQVEDRVKDSSPLIHSEEPRTQSRKNLFKVTLIGSCVADPEFTPAPR